MELKKEDIILLVVFGVFVAGLSIFTYIFFKPSITGFVVYSPQEYTHDNTKVNVSGNEIKLIPITSESVNIIENELTSYLNSAVYNGEDRLNEASSAGDGQVTVKDDKMFNIVFDNVLNNNDKINLYMKKSKVSVIYVCDSGVECSSGYGSASYDGEDGVVTIILSSLAAAKNDFSINNVDDIKIDYITATYKNYTTQVITTVLYPSSAAVETNDLIINNISRWDSLMVDEVLNGQQVNYYYSTDSGNNWNLVQNKDLSLVSVTTKKIKIKIDLLSDGINTPVLSNLNINYSTGCNENWNCSEWSSCSNQIQTRTCDDISNCGTYSNKPDESRACLENLTNQSFTKIIKFEESNAELTVITSRNISNVLFIFANSSLNLENKQRLKSIDITSSENIQGSLLSAVIKVYYNESEINSNNINEGSLSLYYYNGTGWEKISSIVNSTGNYVEANITHFSVYGVFGDINEAVSSPVSSSSGGGSSGGGGGGSSYNEIVPVNQSNTITKEENKEEVKEVVKDEVKVNKSVKTNATEQKNAGILKRFTGYIVRAISDTTRTVNIFAVAFSILVILYVWLHLIRPK